MPERKRISRSSIRVRRAVGADFNDVMDIDGNIYWGFDYLPALYHSFLHHPDVHMYVAELNNEIVGFGGFWIMRTETGIPHVSALAGRVRKDLRGLGISKAITAVCHKLLLRTFPGGFYATRASYYKPHRHEPDAPSWDPKSYITRKWTMIVYKTLVERLKRNIDAVGTCCDAASSVNVYGVRDTIKLLTAPETVHMLRHDGEFVPTGSTWMPMKISLHNLHALAKTQSLVIFKMHHELVTAVSFCESALCNNYVVTDIYSFGDVTSRELGAHLCHYFKQLMSRIEPSISDVRIRLHFPIGLDVAQVESLLEPMLGRRETNNQYSTTKVVSLNSHLPFKQTAAKL